MPHIDYYLSTISPFTYLAGTRPTEIAERYGATISYKPMDLMNVFARTGGVAPKDRHPNRQALRAQELRRASKKAGVEMNFQPAHFPTNMAPSSYAIIAAQKAGGGDLGGLVHSFLRACWAEEKDVADDAVIKACLEAGGFDPSLADTGLLSGAEEYSNNTETAINAGVFGAPFFITDGDERFWGHDRLDDLEAHLAGNL